jgi:hypothetical protein
MSRTLRATGVGSRITSLIAVPVDDPDFRLSPTITGTGRWAEKVPAVGAHAGSTLRSMQILYMTTSGAADPTRASIPLHLAVNGSLEVGHTVGVVLAGDATELIKPDVRERVEGLGVPPVRDLLAKAQQHQVPVYV